MHFEFSETLEATDMELVVRTVEEQVRGLAKNVVRGERQLIAFGIGPSPVVKNGNDRAVFYAAPAGSGICVTVKVSYQASSLLGAVSQNEVVREKIIGALSQARTELRYRSMAQMVPSSEHFEMPVTSDGAVFDAVGKEVVVPADEFAAAAERVGDAGPADAVIAEVVPIEPAAALPEVAGPVARFDKVEPIEADLADPTRPEPAPAAIKAVEIDLSEIKQASIERVAIGPVGIDRIVVESSAVEPVSIAPDVAKSASIASLAGAEVASFELGVRGSGRRSALLVSGVSEGLDLLPGKVPLEDYGTNDERGLGAGWLGWAALVLVGAGVGWMVLRPHLRGSAWVAKMMGGGAAEVKLAPTMVQVAPVVVSTVATAGERDLNAWLLNWAEAVQSHDPERQTAFYADPVDWYFRTQHVGQAALLQAMRTAAKNSNAASTLKVENISIVRQSDDTASVLLMKHFTVRSEKYAPYDQLQWAQLKVKRVGGDWKIVEEHTMSRSPQAGRVQVATPPPFTNSRLVNEASSSQMAKAPLMLSIEPKIPEDNTTPQEASAPHAVAVTGMSSLGGGILGVARGGLDGAPAPVIRVAKPLAGPLRVSSGVLAGLAISQPPPVFPPMARSLHVSGAVVLHAVISKTGRVKNLQVISGFGLLRPSVVDAVRSWRYKPYLLKGEPIEVETTITVTFTNGH